MAVYCCTCTAALPSKEKTEGQPFSTAPRRMPCCNRLVCGRCQETNPRFVSYCPYCQTTTAASPAQNLLPPRLKDPPPYRFSAATTTTTTTTTTITNDAPPPYSVHVVPSPTLSDEKRADDTPILHYLDHDRDSITSLSLRYHVPADLLRRVNRLPADHLLLGRRVIEIPRVSSSSASSYSYSLSPYPVEGEHEARRKAAIRRFMVLCKVADYDMAVLYLDQTASTASSSSADDAVCEYDLAAAVSAYEADEQWERQNPRAAVKGKSSHSSGFLSRVRRHL